MKKQFAVAIIAILLLSVLTAMPVMAGSGDESNSTLTDDRGQTPYVPPLTTLSYPPIATISPVCEELQSYLDCVSTKKADIVFVFDTTGSMYDEIDEMKNISKDFADGLASAGIDYRLGLTEFRDFPVTCDGTACGDLGDFAYKVYNGGVLTSSASTFKSWIGGLSASGGADLPESTLAALTHTVKDQKWRGGDASKIVILMSDAYPHPDGHCCNQEGNKFSGIISALTRNGITVYVVGPDEESMKKIASETGGEFYLIRAGVTLKPILEKITGVIRCSFSIVGDEIACEDNKLEICVQLRGKDNVLIPYRSGYTKAWMYVRCPDGTSHRYDLKYDNKTKSYCATVDPVCGGEPGDVDVTVYGKVCEWSAVERFEVTCGIRRVFFSTEEDFVTFGPEPPDGNPIISDGDLLCSDCTVFARNQELLAAFGTECDLGLDAADVIDVERRLVAFSTELNDLQSKVFACDLLATNGAVIHHFALLAKFDIPDGVIMGLDAAHFIGDKEEIVAFLEEAAKYDRDFWRENPSALPEMLEEYDIDIWFSTEGTAPTPEAPLFLDGDLLSARTGIIVARNALLLPPSVPAGIPNRGVDFGLDAVTADRSGNRERIRFSTEILYEGEPYFTDGDVLRINNGVVCTNEELIHCFEPKTNFLGLDALSIPVKEVCKPSIEVEKKVLDKIEQAWVEQITAHADDTVTFQSKIHNDGTCCPLYDIKVTDILPDSLEYANNAMVNGKQREPDEINDKELTWFFEGPLNPCETITIKFNARVVKCGVDINVQSVKAVCEETGEAVYDEDKATVVVPCVVRKPDLVITDIAGIGVVGEPLNIFYTIKNQGNAAAGPSYTGLWIAGKYIKKDYVGSLAPGAAINLKPFNYTWDCTAGEKAEIKVCADIADQVAESDEANNCKAKTWTCALKKPDLVIKDVKLSKEGDHCYVDYLISNTGTASAPASTTYLYVLVATETYTKVASDSTGALASGASRWDRFTYRTTGAHKFKVCADGPKAISESNETNNCRTEWLTCPELVKQDLVIKDVKLKKMDGYCYVDYLISNTGTVNAAASTTYLYVDDKKVASDSTGSLAPGASRWDRFTAYRTTGTHTYKVCADGPNAISESSEANNCRTEKLTCPLSLDIYFADGGESPGSVYHYNTTTGIEETLYTRPSRRLYSFTFHPHIPQKLYYVNANEYKIYRTHQLPSGWTPEVVVYTHTTYVRDIAFAFDKNGELGLYFSEATGAGGNGKIYKIEDGKASLYYEVKLADVGGSWAGDFAFDDKGNLYLSSGNRIPASIYKVEGGRVKEIFTDEKEPIKGFVYQDGALYYGNWRTKIYRLDISTKERTVVYSNTKRTWLSDVGFRPELIG